MKKNILIMGLLILSIACSGCDGAKQAITAAEFKTSMEALKLTVEDDTDMLGEEVVKAAKLAMPLDYSYILIYCEIESKDSAVEFFNEYADSEKYLNENEIISENIETSGSNFNRKTFTTNKGYYFFCRVNTTVIMAQSDLGFIDEVTAAIKATGY